MTEPMNNGRYRRRFPDPSEWASNKPFALIAEEETLRKVNELSWELAGQQLADEITSELRRTAPRRGTRAGDPGE